MAEIFLARIRGIEGFQKGVVIKRLKADLAATPQLVQMFLDEARLMATLQHSNIVQVYDVGSAGGAYFFSMELLRGEDLRGVTKAARASGGVPLDQALFIMASALEGLHHAHEQRSPDSRPLSIVHRDISPSNIFVTHDGGVKLLDFGIAKTAVQTTQTRAGTLKGKIRYMSPEQCLGRPVDRRTDIFAAAVVLWELTVGRKLFAASSDFEVMSKIIDTDAPPPSTFVPGYPPDLEQIVLKGLRRDPAERYQTAEEMQADIESFAREGKLVMSSRALGRYMHQQFAGTIAAWAAAEARGEEFGDHVMEVFEARHTTDPVSAARASEPKPAPAAPSPIEHHAEAAPEPSGVSSLPSGTPPAHVLPATPHNKTRTMVLAGAVTLAVLGGVAGWIMLGHDASSAPAPSVSSPQEPTPTQATSPLDSAPSATATATATASVTATATAAPTAPSATATVSAEATTALLPEKRPGPARSAKPSSPPSTATTTSSKAPKWDPDAPTLPQ